MQIQLVHNHFDADHLVAVVSKMKTLGAPTIAVVSLGDDRYAALEGCHRIRAAIELGLEPNLNIVEYSDESTESVVPDQFPDSELTIAEVVDDCHTNVTAFFDDDPRISD